MAVNHCSCLSTVFFPILWIKIRARIGAYCDFYNQKFLIFIAFFVSFQLRITYNFSVWLVTEIKQVVFILRKAPRHEGMCGVEAKLHALLTFAPDGGKWAASRSGCFNPGNSLQWIQWVSVIKSSLVSWLCTQKRKYVVGCVGKWIVKTRYTCYVCVQWQTTSSA